MTASDVSNVNERNEWLLSLPEWKFSAPGNQTKIYVKGMPMSTKSRTIEWCESRIVQELSRKRAIVTSLALSRIVLRNVRSLEEDSNLDMAIQNLKSKRVISVGKDEDGFTVFRLAA